MKDDNISKLEAALGEVRDDCEEQKDKGSGFIMLAALRDRVELNSLLQVLRQSFGHAATNLINNLTTVHDLSHRSEEYQKYACEFARNVVREKAIEDYVHKEQMDKDTCRIL